MDYISLTSSSNENTDSEDDIDDIITSFNFDLMPIVYTTRLDDMTIFKQTLGTMTVNDITSCILFESKPKLQEIRSQPVNQNSWENLQQAIKTINSKANSTCSSDFQISDRKIKVEDNDGVRANRIFERNRKLEEQCKPLRIVLEDIILSHKLNTNTKSKLNISIQQTHSLHKQFKSQVKRPSVVPQISNPYIDLTKWHDGITRSIFMAPKFPNIQNDTIPCNNTTTSYNNTQNTSIETKSRNIQYDTTSNPVLKSIVDTQSNVDVKVIDIKNAPKQLKNVAVILRNKVLAELDIYSLDGKGAIVDYLKLSDNRRFNGIPAIGRKITVAVAECCCWYKRKQTIEELFNKAQIILPTFKFMRKFHNCKPHKCVCITCCGKNIFHSAGPLNNSDDSKDLWLRELLEKINVNSTNIIIKALQYDGHRRKRDNVSFELDNNENKTGCTVVNIKTKDALHFYEFEYGGNLLAFRNSQIYTSQKLIANKFGSHVAMCCWFRHQSHIKILNKPYYAKFMSQRHTCHIWNCTCCCRDIDSDKLGYRMLLKYAALPSPVRHAVKLYKEINVPIHKIDYLSSKNESFEPQQKLITPKIISQNLHLEDTSITINENKKVSAILTTPVNKLSTQQLQKLAEMLSYAQQQANEMNLSPGEYYVLEKIGTASDNLNNFTLVRKQKNNILLEGKNEALVAPNAGINSDNLYSKENNLQQSPVILNFQLDKINQSESSNNKIITTTKQFSPRRFPITPEKTINILLGGQHNSDLPPSECFIPKIENIFSLKSSDQLIQSSDNRQSLATTTPTPRTESKNDSIPNKNAVKNKINSNNDSQNSVPAKIRVLSPSQLCSGVKVNDNGGLYLSGQSFTVNPNLNQSQMIQGPIPITPQKIFVSEINHPKGINYETTRLVELNTQTIVLPHTSQNINSFQLLQQSNQNKSLLSQSIPQPTTSLTSHTTKTIVLPHIAQNINSFQLLQQTNQNNIKSIEYMSNQINKISLPQLVSQPGTSLSSTSQDNIKTIAFIQKPIPHLVPQPGTSVISTSQDNTKTITFIQKPSQNTNQDAQANNQLLCYLLKSNPTKNTSSPLVNNILKQNHVKPKDIPSRKKLKSKRLKPKPCPEFVPVPSNPSNYVKIIPKPKESPYLKEFDRSLRKEIDCKDKSTPKVQSTTVQETDKKSENFSENINVNKDSDIITIDDDDVSILGL